MQGCLCLRCFSAKSSYDWFTETQWNHKESFEMEPSILEEESIAMLLWIHTLPDPGMLGGTSAFASVDLQAFMHN